MKPAAKQRSEAMGRDTIWRLLFRFSGPTIISMLVSSSYNIVDAVYVGRLGPAAVAALAIFFPINMVWMAFAMGTGVGASSLISQNLGAKNYARANRIFGITITLGVAFGAVLTAVALPNLEGMVRLFGATGEVVPLAKAYTGYHVAFLWVFLFSIILANTVRAEGSPMLSSVAQFVSAIVNIVLDPILIFGWGPVPRLGVSGAAIATVIAWWSSFGIFLFYYLAGRSSFRPRLRDLIPDFKTVRDIYRIGAASIARMIAGSIVQTQGNVVAASYGVIPLGVKGVLLRAVSFAFMPCMGVGQAVLPLVAYNYGAGKKGRIGEVVTKGGIMVLSWSGLCFLGAELFPRQVMAVFSNNPEFIRVGAEATRIFCLAAFTVGIQMISSFYFQATGQGLASFILASTRQIIFLLPALAILPRIFGIKGLWFSFPVADVSAVAITLVWLVRSFRKTGIPFTLSAKGEALEVVPVSGLAEATNKTSLD
ncbi:MAG: MATE family efflux transporter [Chloroflexota bacterium]